MLYDIDGEHSVKMIHENSRKRYAGTTGADTIDLQIKPNYKKDAVNDYSSEESSYLSTM